MAGAYTFDELKALLFQAADPGYLTPFFEGAYGNGRELFEQLIAVLIRVDQGINRTLQGLFILPWSGQTAPPAAGGSRSVLTLTLARSRRPEIPLTFGAGAILFQEIAPDWGDSGGVEVTTGRQYTLTHDITFLPGDTSPKQAEIVATRVGYGFANPMPGTIKGILQPGAKFQNNKASIVQTPQAARLIVQPGPDVIVPEHVGQYVQLTAGANAGQVRRIVGYQPASSGNGGIALLAVTFVGRSLVAAPAGDFEIGEQVEQINTVGPTIVAKGVVLAVGAASPWYIVVETTEGEFKPTAGTIGAITGVLSGATFTVEDVTQRGQLLPETATASWIILDWFGDLGASATNEEGTLVVPGSYALLDALGGERGIARAPGEDDETYRTRVAQVADLVSPNAIRRIGNRIFAPYGGSVCLREVGLSLFPGMMCDSPPGAVSDLSKYAYDLDGLLIRGIKTGDFFDGERVYQDNGGILSTARVTSTLLAAAPGSPVPVPNPAYLEIAALRGKFEVGALIVGEVSGATFAPGGISFGLRPQDRFKQNLDYTEFRAFFEVGVPLSDLGEFGIPYDAPHPYNAFDASPYLTFADGFPLTAAVLYINTWQAIDRARAGGVGFDLYLEDIGCI